MRNFNLCAAALLAAAILFSCSPKASVSGKVDGASEEELVVKSLDVNHYKVVDSIKTDSKGRFSFKMDIPKDDPQFVYVYKGDRKLTSLLLQSGDRVSVDADTLGKWTVKGSEECEKLLSVEQAYSAFLAEMTGIIETSEDVNRDLSRRFIAYRRDRLGYVMENSKSLSVVPVLFQKLNEKTPIFNEPTDAILLGTIADSLKSVYPESRYVKSLEKEAARRRTSLEMQYKLQNASEIGYIDIELPGMDGKKTKLSETEGKVVMLYFWATTAEQKMFNIDALLPLYNEFHDRGFQIYAVSFDVDKTVWATVVKNQKLPWVNVCDTRGNSSPVIGLYQLTSLPTAYFIVDGELDTEAKVSDEASIREYLKKKL